MDLYSEYSDQKLVLLLQKDDELAFRTVFNRWHKKLYQFCLRYIPDHVQAEEVVQDSLLNLWLYRKKIKAEQSIDSLLYTICKRLCLNKLRDVARSNANIESFWSTYVDHCRNTEDKLRENELRNLVKQVIEKLPTQQRTVFELSKIQGLSHGQIAQELNISKETVKKHSAEALKFLRRQLGPYLTFLSLFMFIYWK